jgi:hypothetical protein
VAREEELDGAGTLTGAWRRVRAPMRMNLARLGQLLEIFPTAVDVS